MERPGRAAPAGAARRWRVLRAGAEAWIPLLLLSLAAISPFVFQNHADGFEWGHRGYLSSHGMALAKNLMVGDHPLFMYASRSIEDGRVSYEAYNRFPVFPFLLIGAWIRPFAPDLARQIHAARQLMNLFLGLTLLTVFLLLNRLVRNRYQALAITLLAFSSYYVLFFSDMIFNDAPALFGFVLALYAFVSLRGSRPGLPRLLLFSLLPLALGWQPYAVFIAWCALDLVQALGTTQAAPLRERLALFFRGPAFLLSALAVLWGGLLLGLQLVHEWRIVGGSFSELPSVRSMLWRIGANPGESVAEYEAAIRWGRFLLEQCRRIVVMLVPFASILDVTLDVGSALSAPLALIAAALLVLGLRSTASRSLGAGVPGLLACSGLIWALLMRSFVAYHAFQAIYYLGFAVAFYLVLSLFVDQRAYRTAAVALTVMFVICVARMNSGKAGIAQDVNAVTAEFQTISAGLPRGAKVFIDGDRHELGFGYHAVDFYLAGSFYAPLKEADYVISKNPQWNGRRLTANPKVNLFKVERH